LAKQNIEEKIEATRLYLKQSANDYSKLLWFKEHKLNEMMLGFGGLITDNAQFCFEYPDRNVSLEEMQQLRTEYKNFKPRKRIVADHIIVHQDGKIHLKLKDQKEKYVHKVRLSGPINDQAPVFLDFFVLSDILSKYKKTKSVPENPHVKLNVPPNHVVILRCRFSGAKYNLEKIVAEEEATIASGQRSFPAVLLDGKAIKGIFTWQVTKIDREALNNRPEGTIVLLRFQLDSKKYLIKTITFA